MTKEEAIRIISGEVLGTTEQTHEAVAMAVEALSAQSQQVTSKLNSDCISRQDAIDAVRRLQTYKLSEGDNMLLVDKAEVQTELMMLPSAQRKGKWIPGKEFSREFIGITELHIEYEKFTCSSCGLTVKDLLYHVDGSPFYKFCPNCGAEMKGESDG